VSKASEDAVGRGLVALGAAALLGSLFLTWSHQLPPGLVAAAGPGAFAGVPRDPTAWQVYSAADVLLALLAGALAAASVRGGRRARRWVAAASVIALAFVVHAVAVPPTNGALAAAPGRPGAGYVPDHAGAGIGETLAVLGLTLTLSGVTLTAHAGRHPY
jgi:hypothetical protein